ncbi:MAG: hypothetical protein IIA62_10115 [Nitrospinae bacterium]|nr:hypothetical protein [Nitrospinota bacterium]
MSKIASQGAILFRIHNHRMNPLLKFSGFLLVAVLVLLSALSFLSRPDFSFGQNTSNLKGEAFVKEYIRTFHRGNINEIFSYMGTEEMQLPEGSREEMGEMMENMGQMFNQAMGGALKYMIAMLVPQFNQGKISSMTLKKP